MGIVDENLDEVLVETGALKIEHLKEAWEIQRKTNKGLQQILEEMKFVQKNDILFARAKKMGLEYRDLSKIAKLGPDVLEPLPAELARKHCIFPLDIDDDTIIIAMKDPTDVYVLEDIQVSTSLKVKAVYADHIEIERLIEQNYVKEEKQELPEEKVEEAEEEAGEASNNMIEGKIGKYLTGKEIITSGQFQLALKLQKENGGSIGEILISQGYIDKNAYHEALKKMGVNYADVKEEKINDKMLEKIGERLARRHTVLPIEVEGITLKVAMSDSSNIFAIDDLRLATGFEIIPLLADGKDITAYIDKFFEGRKKEEEKQKKSTAKKKAKPVAEVIDFDEEMKKVHEEIKVEITQDIEDSVDISDVQNAPIVKMVKLIFNKAASSKASDIHIEPHEDVVVVRNRIDGQLVEVMRNDIKILPALIARIKILSGLNIAEKRIPQDGRISLHIDSRSFDMRVSILPAVFGEKAVIRLADKEGFNVKKEELGFFEDDLKKFDKILANPHGIVLVTGPTGSGKSTTLYTALKELCSPEINIMTVEDPVENTIEGINQVQVNVKAGMTFAVALRAFLRQDPDIIMVGEIRDPETAEIATRAAITGHLVLSTLHTNDAASSITRVIDMGIEPYMLASSIVGVIAQRLVRRFCSDCKEEYEPTESEKGILRLEPGDNVKLFRPKGCDKCSNTGYKGRIAVYEIMTVDSELMELIAHNKPAGLLKEAALKKGMKTLQQNCIQLVTTGITSIDEMLRITYARD